VQGTKFTILLSKGYISCLQCSFIAKVLVIKLLSLKFHYLDDQEDKFPIFSTTVPPLHGTYALVSFSAYVQARQFVLFAFFSTV